MTNPRLAIRYAKSLLDLAKEKGKLEEVFNDMKLLDSICKTSREFANVRQWLQKEFNSSTPIKNNNIKKL